MRHVLCDAKLRRLTKTPTENAPNTPIMESYGEDDKVILGLEWEFTVPDRWRHITTVIASR
jgi:hypothetical protein